MHAMLFRIEHEDVDHYVEIPGEDATIVDALELWRNAMADDTGEGRYLSEMPSAIVMLHTDTVMRPSNVAYRDDYDLDDVDVDPEARLRKRLDIVATCCNDINVHFEFRDGRVFFVLVDGDDDPDPITADLLAGDGSGPLPELPYDAGIDFGEITEDEDK